jgi:hypothetical protein
MISYAKSLVEQFREAQSGASVLLEEAVRKGELKIAWEVFQELEELLPKLDWIPSSDTFPKIREFIDQLELNRYTYVSLFDTLCEEASMVVEGVSDKEFLDISENTREEIEALMWEIMRKGYAGFTNDW